ncbi:hypothetical protein DRO60_05840 [Candidatus Bathyarchaeota archaeon]|nr:MAG: hypothetical protein DRO60_05840 [Candidatus Bathyarchaeota archaeon]
MVKVPARAVLAASFFMTLVALALFIVGIIYMVQGEEFTSTAFLLGALVLTGISWVVSRAVAAAAREVPLVRVFEVSTEFTCPSCGFREVRAFRKGDYIFKPAGKCPRCGGERYISSIFREERAPEVAREESL